MQCTIVKKVLSMWSDLKTNPRIFFQLFVSDFKKGFDFDDISILRTWIFIQKSTKLDWMRFQREGGDRPDEIPTFSRGLSGLRDLMSFHVSPKSCRPRVQLWLPVPPHQASQWDQNGLFFTRSCFNELFSLLFD